MPRFKSEETQQTRTDPHCDLRRWFAEALPQVGRQWP
jgi:hypothetical protein